MVATVGDVASTRRGSTIPGRCPNTPSVWQEKEATNLSAETGLNRKKASCTQTTTVHLKSVSEATDHRAEEDVPSGPTRGGSGLSLDKRTTAEDEDQIFHLVLKSLHVVRDAGRRDEKHGATIHSQCLLPIPKDQDVM